MKFPIIPHGRCSSISIPWEVIAPHEPQALKNHGGQTLRRLAERGGLSWCEALAVLKDRAWEKVEESEAEKQVIEIVKKFLDRNIEKSTIHNRFLFRGKWLVNGELVIGFLTSMWGQMHIIKPDDENSAYSIDPATISQCTGIVAAKSYRGEELEDRLIFEGDILKRDIFGNDVIGQVLWFDIGHTGFFLKVKNSYYPIGKGQFCGDESDICSDEIIGNLWENPEMVEMKNG